MAKECAYKSLLGTILKDQGLRIESENSSYESRTPRGRQV